MKMVNELSKIQIFSASSIICAVIITVQLYILFYLNQFLWRYHYSLNKKPNISSESIENLKRMKMILLWENNTWYPFENFISGTSMFTKRNCSYQNCYFVKNITDHPGISYEHYHAIMFNGGVLQKFTAEQKPKKRNRNQRYIFIQMDSNYRYPICDEYYDNFFNWTITYRLDSSIPWTYFLVKDIRNRTVGPFVDTAWIEERDMRPIEKDLIDKLRSKRKLAAWLISNCRDRDSGRQAFVKLLKSELDKYNESVHIYGGCGIYKCPKHKTMECEDMMRRDYAFYLAFENSFGADYVSEKPLRGLLHNMVPIVYGGANYSRFLPPGSYIDAASLGPTKLATLMHEVAHDENKYFNYFKWRNHYTFQNNMNDFDVACELCAKLNEDSETSVWPHFRKWWNHQSSICNVRT